MYATAPYGIYTIYLYNFKKYFCLPTIRIALVMYSLENRKRAKSVSYL